MKNITKILEQVDFDHAMETQRDMPRRPGRHWHPTKALKAFASVLKVSSLRNAFGAFIVALHRGSAVCSGARQTSPTSGSN